VLYLDANIFIFAALNTEEIGNKAVSLLEEIQRGDEQAVTSALTFDEVFWEVKKNRGMEKAIETAEAMLNFPNLEIVAADKTVVYSAIEVIKKYHLAPRDALHVATAIGEKVDYVVTADVHFGRVKELKIRDL